MTIREEETIGKIVGRIKAGGNAKTVETRELVINHSFCNYTSRNFKSNNCR